MGGGCVCMEGSVWLELLAKLAFFYPTLASILISSWLCDITLSREGTKTYHLLVFYRLTFSCENILSWWSQIKLCTSWAFIKAAEISFHNFFYWALDFGELVSTNEYQIWLSQPEHLCGGATEHPVQHCSLAGSDYPGHLRIFISSTHLLKLQPYQRGIIREWFGTKCKSYPKQNKSLQIL